MRRLVAAVMLVLLAALACGDPLLCPDGCNNDSELQTSAPAPMHADCLACRNAISTALPAFDLLLDGLAQRNDQSVPPGTVYLEPASIDHPPRVG